VHLYVVGPVTTYPPGPGVPEHHRGLVFGRWDGPSAGPRPSLRSQTARRHRRVVVAVRLSCSSAVAARTRSTVLGGICVGVVVHVVAASPARAARFALRVAGVPLAAQNVGACLKFTAVYCYRVYVIGFTSWESECRV